MTKWFWILTGGLITGALLMLVGLCTAHVIGPNGLWAAGGGLLLLLSCGLLREHVQTKRAATTTPAK
ncbi:hypothetical protein [Lactiplantibacillus modestisalitolerans]|uniref:Integral membrane protein n=1 Tax=Lactiplantibacillus modestisalitolerans TaxID=1457219 RepID=A0ABV5WW91_9LACO|nr:hypothetical protein [Lactiplantibacillus modestisalitolerans]